MSTWSRRRIETILLAVLAIATVIQLRFVAESRFWFLMEMGTLAVLALVAESAKALGTRKRKSKLLANCLTIALPLSPILFAMIARYWGSPIAFEMSTLATLGAASLALAIIATSNRTRSLSLILSGFLVLFCGSISEGAYAAVLPLIWMLGCVWHLIANHWERLDLAMPDFVQRTWSVRPSVLVVALIVLSVGGFAVKDRMSSKQLMFGWMPTSGGNRWSDPAARSGVGAGDAAIAAKDHAESFGAVDSDIFLETTELTLFDMFSDLIGEPIGKPKKSERAQAMGNENFIPSHQRSAKSEKGGATFSIERLPAKESHDFKDANDASVIQWDGPTGIRLAMQRYDTFDGHDWTQSADRTNENLTRVDIGDAAWFFDPAVREFVLRHPEAMSVGLMKVIRLDSARLAVPMMTAAVHIKDIDRPDFFGISKDGSFFMPGREKVPPLTVLHVANVNLMEDDIREHLAVSIMEKPDGDSLNSQIEELVQAAIANHADPLDQLNACIELLRSEFKFVRAEETGSTSLTEFLESRSGGDHLFATTAALMARELGLPSRLVTGFYVRPDALDIAAGHSSVLPQDVHVWAEVQLSDDRWFEIESTPGYKPPQYQPSWRLVARRFAAAHWPTFLIGVLLLSGGYVTRRFWIDGLLAAIWSLARWLRPHYRIRLAMRIIETRANLAGERRPAGKSQRAWLEQLTRTDAKIANAAQQFSNAADVLFFGHGNEIACDEATRVVDLLRVSTIIALSKKMTS